MLRNMVSSSMNGALAHVDHFNSVSSRWSIHFFKGKDQFGAVIQDKLVRMGLVEAFDDPHPPVPGALSDVLESPPSASTPVADDARARAPEQIASTPPVADDAPAPVALVVPSPAQAVPPARGQDEWDAVICGKNRLVVNACMWMLLFGPEVERQQRVRCRRRADCFQIFSLSAISLHASCIPVPAP